jgi:hypothetical protein
VSETKQKIPFPDLPQTPAEHFKLYFYAAVLHILEQVAQSFESHEAMFEQFPFLVGYHDELASRGLDGQTLEAAKVWWHDALAAWEGTIDTPLPICSLRKAAGLDYAAFTLLMSIGLIEEDARFGLLFETMQSSTGSHRPTFGLLNAWWREPVDGGEVRTALRQLQDLGLVQIVNPDAPRMEWALQLPSLLWDVLRGDTREQLSPWLRYVRPAHLLPYDDLIISDAQWHVLTALPTLLDSGEAKALIVRGPHNNGRHTLLGAVARILGYGMLEINGQGKTDDERWHLAGPLATLLHALPVIAFDLAPGETAEIPCLHGYDGPLGVVLGKQGGIKGSQLERALTLTLELPASEERRQLWQRSFGTRPVIDLDEMGERLRITSGNIQRTARLAQSYAMLDGHEAVTLADVRQASHSLNRQVLETLATFVEPSGDWNQLAASAETQHELLNLENRCRYRERLRDFVGTALSSHLNSGVRVLFSGPSGTGKTLAARLLASVLHMDLYRLDLSTVVNKYIGETEKNLNQVFALAEELDVILLLDEGDALLTRRTNVQTSNDRYANLETNYLLQRLETFEGILIITTNANDRIDSAFQRRLDMVIDFRPPETAERWVIWQLHLPVTHAIDLPLLQEVAGRCNLTGGQIRNVVLHASLLGLSDGGVITSTHLEASLQREYRKMGTIYPLRRQYSALSDWR